MIQRLSKRLLLGALLLLAACEQGEDTPHTPLPPRIDRFEVSPTATEVGESVVYSWQLTAAETATCSLDVDGDGTPDYTPDCDAGSQAHTFSEPGSYTARLTVTGGDQDVTVTAPAITVTEGVEEPNVPSDALSWQPAAPQPYGVAEGQGVAVGDKLYVFGGFDSQRGCCTPTERAHVYDVATDSWNVLADLPAMNGTGNGGVTHAGVATDGTDIFLASGYTSNDSGRGQIFGTREVWQYVVASDAYTRLPDLPAVRAAGQLEYLNGSLYYFGGTDKSRDQDTSDLYILDLKGGATSWREGAPLPNGRHHMGSAVLNGKIYAVGGQHDHDNKLTTQADVHAYTPESDSWEQLADLPKALSHIANSTFVLDGRIVVAGGEVAHGDPVDDVFAYTPKSDLWTSLTPLPVALQSAVARSVGEQIVLTGGSGGGWREETYLGIPVR